MSIVFFLKHLSIILTMAAHARTKTMPLSINHIIHSTNAASICYVHDTVQYQVLRNYKYEQWITLTEYFLCTPYVVTMHYLMHQPSSLHLCFRVDINLRLPKFRTHNQQMAELGLISSTIISRTHILNYHAELFPSSSFKFKRQLEINLIQLASPTSLSIRSLLHK